MDGHWVVWDVCLPRSLCSIMFRSERSHMSCWDYCGSLWALSMCVRKLTAYVWETHCESARMVRLWPCASVLYITCRWVELWVHPVFVSFSVENSRNCEWLPWHAHNGVGCRFVGWMLVGFLASTLDLFEVHFHVLYIFCVRKAFCHASHVRLSCKLRIAELQVFLFAVFLTLWLALRKKKETTCSKPHSLKTQTLVFSLPANCQGFMALGHRDPTAPGVSVALDLPYNNLMSCFFGVWKKQTFSESDQYYSRYYEHLHLKAHVLCSLDIADIISVRSSDAQKRWSKNCTCWISSLRRWNSSMWSEVAPSKANVL